LVASNLTISFSVRGQEDVTIIKEYLDECKKNGQQQSKVIVNAIKQYINLTTLWIEEEHREIHMKEISDILNAAIDGDQGGFKRYLQSSECTRLNVECHICRTIYRNLCGFGRDEDKKDDYIFSIITENEKSG
jgi:hypothetical protein